MTELEALQQQLATQAAQIDALGVRITRLRSEIIRHRHAANGAVVVKPMPKDPAK